MDISKLKYAHVLKGVPIIISDSKILNLLHTNEITWEYFEAIKEMTNLKDEVISGLLNISVRSFRSYRQSNSKLKENLKEHVIVLLSLIKR